MELNKIPYRISHRAVKYPRLEFKTGELLVILPTGYDHDVLLKKYKSWIIEKFEFIKGCLEKAKGKELVKRTEGEFREVINSIVRETSRELEVELNRIYFRKMRTKWASLSALRNLTVNRMMRYLPEDLIEYVIFHELAHMIEKKHNERFWEIIEKRYENYQEMEREMFVYWFLIFGDNRMLGEEGFLK